MNALGRSALESSLGSTLGLAAVSPDTAVDKFLAAMQRTAQRSYPAWYAVLKRGIDSCQLDFDSRRAVFEIHPLEDYYFAGAIGMEAAKVRGLFGPRVGAEVLAAIGERVDATALRHDRVVSGIVFDVIGRISLLTPERHILPHDETVRVLLTRMGIDTQSATAHLMTDLFFRHQLGESFAREFPAWWALFHGRFTLAEISEPDPTGDR